MKEEKPKRERGRDQKQVDFPESALDARYRGREGGWKIGMGGRGGL